MNYFKLIQVVACEYLLPRPFPREPEPNLVMSDHDQVVAFDRVGGEGGILEDIYLWNIAGLSKRIPLGGTLVDLGCGSGWFIYHLKKYRPDVKVYGIDLASEMLKLAQENLSAFSDVHFIEGDMIAFEKLVPDRIDAISSIFSLHHLPSGLLLKKLIVNLVNINARKNAKIWLFDHARPRSRYATSLYPKASMPNESLTITRDSQNSLIASFSFEEMKLLLAALPSLIHRKSKLIPYYQAHVSPSLSSTINIPNSNRSNPFKTIMGESL